MFSIKDKVALVTGGAGCIGLEVVKELLRQQAKGVTIIDISTEACKKAEKEILAEFGPGKALIINADVAVKKLQEDAFEQTVKYFKQLDIIITSALFGSEIEWERALDVNLIAPVHSTYLGIQKYLPKYKTDEGVIVNLGSICGLNAVEDVPSYATAKTGLIGLGKAFGTPAHYKVTGVRIISICPGVVDSPLWHTGTRYPGFKKEVVLPNKYIHPVDFVAKHIVDIIKKGANGSVWVIDNNEPAFEVVHPKIDEMRKIKKV